MKHVAQRPCDGRVEVLEVPWPALRPGWLLVANRASLISAGTERSKVEMGAKSLLSKARARPDLVRKVVDRARVEGPRAALQATRDRLDAWAPIGYSSAGVVLEVGSEVTGFSPGDRVACGGGGWANHAEVVAVPRNLAARIDDSVSYEAAAYATVGAIALHGIRRAEVTVGNRVGVIGLGLVGQLVVRLLVASGCRPVGIDLDPAAVALAEEGGARAVPRESPDLRPVVTEATAGHGLDAVLVCAATSATDPVRLAADISRAGGRVVVVGDVPVEADRSVMYDKELELRLSRSYGPGRYDRDYEERGIDVPMGYVRWTEQRNIDAFVTLVADGRIDPTSLTTHRFEVENAAGAYDLLANAAGSDAQRPFGIVLEYPDEVPRPPGPPVARSTRARSPRETGRVGLIGGGSFARGTLIAALRAAGAELAAITTRGGLSAADVAARFGFERIAESADELLHDESIGSVIIATRHADHAELTAAALAAGKAVFVEKPLALDAPGVETVRTALGEESILMVGFNRRFAPATQAIRDLRPPGPVSLTIRVNAGPLPEEHWLHDLHEGGGRLIGEGCHFVDLASHLAASHVEEVHAFAVPQPARPLQASDEAVAVLRMADGSVASILYTGKGDARLPKERIELFGGGLAAVIDDFRRLEVYRDAKRSVTKGRQDKGHRQQIKVFMDAVRGHGPSPDPAGYVGSTLATLAVAESLRTGSSSRP